MSRWKYSCEKTGSETLAGRYMRKFWQPIHVTADIPTERSKPIRVMGEQLTLYRGKSGAPYLVDHRCAHRGTQLSVGRVEGEDIRCLYHGWKYDGNGQCLEQPGELENEFSSRVKIRSHPAQNYHGLIFAYLGSGETPKFPVFPELEGNGVIEARAYRRECNLANFIDNQLDEVHVGFTHPVGFGRIPEIPDINLTRTEFSAVTHSSRPGRVDRITEFLMPNILRFKATSPYDGVNWSEAVAWRVPEDDTATYSYLITRNITTKEGEGKFLKQQQKLRTMPVPDVDDCARRILAGEMTYDEAIENMDEHDPRYDVTLEDHLAIGGQASLANRGTEALGQSDIGVTAVRDLWNEQLALLAKQGDVKTWDQPPAFIATSGEEKIEAPN